MTKYEISIQPDKTTATIRIEAKDYEAVRKVIDKVLEMTEGKENPDD